MKLDEYIKSNYKSKVEFANHCGITKQRVNEMINRKCVVIEGHICSKPSNSYFVNRGKPYRRLLKL